jgi:hypothetical protein
MTGSINAILIVDFAVLMLVENGHSCWFFQNLTIMCFPEVGKREKNRKGLIIDAYSNRDFAKRALSTGR